MLFQPRHALVENDQSEHEVGKAASWHDLMERKLCRPKECENFLEMFMWVYLHALRVRFRIYNTLNVFQGLPRFIQQLKHFVELTLLDVVLNFDYPQMNKGFKCGLSWQKGVYMISSREKRETTLCNVV